MNIEKKKKKKKKSVVCFKFVLEISSRALLTCMLRNFVSLPLYLSFYLLSIGEVDKVLRPHRGNQDATADAGGCAAIVTALVNFFDSPDVSCSVVQVIIYLNTHVKNASFNTHSQTLLALFTNILFSAS
jgi:hypothetical protein